MKLTFQVNIEIPDDTQAKDFFRYITNVNEAVRAHAPEWKTKLSLTRPVKSPADFEAWKERAAAYAENELGLDILPADDPYEIGLEMMTAFTSKRTPKAFIDEFFEEDFAARNYNDHLRQQSEEALAAEEEESV